MRLMQILLVLPACLQWGCAQVRVDAGPGQTHIEHRWGVLSVSINDNKSSHVVRMESVGIAQSPFGWSVGYAQQSWAALGDDCRLVIWVSEPEHLETARRLEASNKGVCVVSPHNHQQEETHRENQSQSDRTAPRPGP